ncbi:1-acyl-sn-glycerol-3-phosphate acyltransferase [Lacticaseibacillus porcinae]|uniref:1-acyl-sn-glycerol-3-phosphate acyltransferase n=1 Tax=Lacticaseibacillus porcinae TaxID=1123687 RepID=UPI000F7BAD92|nr:1-acyl-sn-glycerol-3-phosphate acyltransferase [Lacticaseibacillus porcinae]
MQHHYTYQDFHQDVIQSPHQNAQIPANFNWEPNRLQQALVNPLATGFAHLYRHWHGIRVIGVEKLTPGAFIYANHTQPVGDVFVPRTLPFPVSIIAGPANLGIPVIGKLLPAGRAILLPNTRKQYPQFLAAIKRAHTLGQLILVYPEAHVWPFYPGIRPFDATSFHYPAQLKAPVFTMTTTYQPGRWPHQVQTTIYIDGPLPVDPTLPLKQQQHALFQHAQAQLIARSRFSTETVVHYTLEDEHD